MDETISIDPPQPGRPRSTQADRAILEAAITMMIEDGVDAVKVETVAKRSGVSRATVYRRYPRREDLVIAAVAESYRVHLERPAPEEPTMAEMVDGVARGIADQRIRGLLRRMMIVRHDHPQFFAEFRTATDSPSRDQVIRNVLERAAADGAFPPDSDLEMVQTLFAGSIGTHLLTHSDEESAEEISRYLFRVLRTLGYHPISTDTKES